jgi:hypothetical protein
MIFYGSDMALGHPVNLQEFLGGSLKNVLGCFEKVYQTLAEEISDPRYTFK